MTGSSESPPTQDAVIAFLLDPRSYPDEAKNVTRIDTHAAIVFLAGDRAYKLKRAVKLPYLDFSTLDKRRRVIARELEINSRASPELYLSILPVTARVDTSGFELGGSGEAVDWLLVMRRFDQAALLSTLASHGSLDHEMVATLASTIEHFHRQSEPVKNAEWLKTLTHIVADLESELCSASARANGLQLEAYIERLRQALGANAALIEEREHEGFVRRCHGDLHLKNLVLWEGKPRLFDAIEFDDKLATIDILYDLAFLLMDRWRRGLKREANAILNHILQGAGIRELSGLALLPLFLSVRAAVRAMTGLQGLAFLPESKREHSILEIQSYAAFAESLLTRKKAQLIAIGGISGTGKTTVAREIAPFVGGSPGAVHLRTDVERKIMLGVALSHRLPPELYSAGNRDEVYRRLLKKAGIALDCGCSVIIDAVLRDDAYRTLLRDHAQRAGACFQGFWLEASIDQIRDRVASRTGDASDAGVSVAQHQWETISAPSDWIKIQARGTLAETVDAISRELSTKNGS
jgi:aminoglycoside phosphotransferase family enzyme/predicted kinase